MTDRPDEQTPEHPQRQQVFLPRETYRQRRLQDAVQLVPIAGLVLFVIPIFWVGAGWSLTTVVTYLFGVWAVLIVLSAVLVRLLRSDAVPEPDTGERRVRDDTDGGS